MALETSTRFGSGGKGGFLSSLKRAVGGGQLFLTEYTSPSNGGFIALAAPMPGVIKELTIDPQDEFMVQSGGFMAGTRDVEVSVGAAEASRRGRLRRCRAGVPEAVGQRPGVGGAERRDRRLPAAGRPRRCSCTPPTWRCSTLPMELNFATVKGVKNKFFGDSLFMAEIHGPGHVWLQSMTMAKLAEAIEPYLPDRSRDRRQHLTLTSVRSLREARAPSWRWPAGRRPG